MFGHNRQRKNKNVGVTNNMHDFPHIATANPHGKMALASSIPLVVAGDRRVVTVPADTAAGCSCLPRDAPYCARLVTPWLQNRIWSRTSSITSETHELETAIETSLRLGMECVRVSGRPETFSVHAARRRLTYLGNALVPAGRPTDDEIAAALKIAIVFQRAMDAPCTIRVTTVDASAFVEGVDPIPDAHGVCAFPRSSELAYSALLWVMDAATAQGDGAKAETPVIAPGTVVVDIVRAPDYSVS